MKRGQKVIYSDGNITVTLREVLFGIIIFLVMLTAGFFISEKIASANDEANQKYYQAVKIDRDAELFQYGMRTNIGNAFVSGTLEAVGPVSYEELDGEYSYIEKVKEKYTKKTRKVKKTKTVNGKTQTYYVTETYWEWDVVDRESKHCDSIRFLDTDFAYGTIGFPMAYHTETMDGGYHIRYKYYVCDLSYNGTIYADLRDNTVGNAVFIGCDTPAEAMEYMVDEGKVTIVLFWIFWIGLSCAAVYGFWYFENNWLED